MIKKLVQSIFRTGLRGPIFNLLAFAGVSSLWYIVGNTLYADPKKIMIMIISHAAPVGAGPVLRVVSGPRRGHAG